MLLPTDACWSAVDPAWSDTLICGARDEEVHWYHNTSVLEGKVDLPPHGIALVDTRVQSA